MFVWEKLGKVYDPQNYPSRPTWMSDFAIAPNTLVYGSQVRVYFGCRPPKDVNANVVTHVGFVDLNRKNLLKIENISKHPVISLGGKGCFDEFGTYPFSLIRQNDKIIAYYAGWTRCESVPFNTGIGTALSVDGGENFTRLGPGPVIPYSLSEPFVLSSPKIRKFGEKFYLFYVSGKKWISVNGRHEISHKIRLASSDDGLNWEKFNKDLISDNWDPDESQASPDVFFANGKYHMFFCGWIPQTFRKDKYRRIGYAWSYDLFNWTRDDDKSGINTSNLGWDSEMVAYPHVFELDNKIYMLYNGNEVGRYGFGLAVLNGSL